MSARVNVNSMHAVAFMHQQAASQLRRAMHHQPAADPYTVFIALLAASTQLSCLTMFLNVGMNTMARPMAPKMNPNCLHRQVQQQCVTE